MANLLAKMPQQRIRAGEKHPTVLKLEKLFDYMDELKLDITLELDTIYVIDRERPQDNDWEIRDIVDSNLLRDLPCNIGAYKLTRNVDIDPREAQPAPAEPIVKKKSKTVKTEAKKVPAPKPVQSLAKPTTKTTIIAPVTKSKGKK